MKTTILSTPTESGITVLLFPIVSLIAQTPLITSWLVIVIGDENEGPEKVTSQIPEPLSN
ncbi:MAG: hypothetical protein HC932_00405 [Thermales bacterium]|nr:hypothetical protein [Thermales bacterium]